MNIIKVLSDVAYLADRMQTNITNVLFSIFFFFAIFARQFFARQIKEVFCLNLFPAQFEFL